jgi:hypothetical protein
MRYRETEGSDRRLKGDPVIADHLVTPLHTPNRGFNHSGAGVLKGLTGS